MNSFTVATVVRAYLKNRSHNIVVVGNVNSELHVFDNAKIIAEKFSDNVITLLNSGYSISKVTFVGFSLGAKAIAPLASRYITKKSAGKYVLPRLVGLDPGIVQSTEFALVDGTLLNQKDATFVVTIHTDCNLWGSHLAVGHANFWVNGGCRQPKCAMFLSSQSELGYFSIWYFY